MIKLVGMFLRADSESMPKTGSLDPPKDMTRKQAWQMLSLLKLSQVFTNYQSVTEQVDGVIKSQVPEPEQERVGGAFSDFAQPLLRNAVKKTQNALEDKDVKFLGVRFADQPDMQ